MRRSGAANCSELARFCRNSANTAPSALKPVVFTLAILLATMSSSRCSAVCRDRPMRRAFSIDVTPLTTGCPPRPPFRRSIGCSPKRPLGQGVAEPVPTRQNSVNINGLSQRRAIRRRQDWPFAGAHPAKSTGFLRRGKDSINHTNLPSLPRRRRRPRPVTVPRREPASHLTVIGVSIHGRREGSGTRGRGRDRRRARKAQPSRKRSSRSSCRR